jgi:hypothetical protein
MNLRATARLGGEGTGRRWASTALAACICVAAAACGSSAATGTPVATAAATDVPATPDAGRSDPTGAPSAETRLVVLAAGADGTAGLWTYAQGAWSESSQVPGATALGRDGQSLILAVTGALERRALSGLGSVGAKTTLSWASQPAAGPIVAVAGSGAGVAAIVSSSSDSLAFNLVAADGKVSGLSPAPSSPFGPSVGWLDGGHLAVISADSMQIPRVAVVDTSQHKIVLLKGLAGVRTFTVSPDGQTLAAATETAVFVAPVSDWLADKVPGSAVTLKPSQVVWDLALSGDGSRLAMLSGTADAQGAVGDIREIGYIRGGTEWSSIFESVVPFGRDSGQVWLS